MEIPDNYKFTKEHEWVRIEGDQAVMGITAFAGQELGEVVFIELPEIGKQVGQSDPLCVVESTKAASDVYSPIGGTVAEGNTQLDSQPDLVNSSPYQDGWMVKLGQLTTSDLDSLMSAAEYRQFLGDKI